VTIQNVEVVYCFQLFYSKNAGNFPIPARRKEVLTMKRLLACALVLALTLCACGTSNSTTTGSNTTTVSSTTTTTASTESVAGDVSAYAAATQIVLSDGGVTVDGEAASTDAGAAVYTARDIVYYEEGHDFTYGEGTEADEHTAQEADAHLVVHITRPGTYVLSGILSAGQVAVDLGEDAEDDPDAVVTLILNGVDITCTVAPGVIFYNVYECGSSDAETAVMDVDTSAAGANVIIADGSVNNVTGSYVARIYKSVELSEDGKSVVDSKKLHKYDAAFYSRKTMNVTGGEAGTGILNINADNEGLDTELHLTINGGNINIVSGNDGINTNEDYVSVTTINAGSVNIVCDGSTGEGDGIDSNGWLVINGGTVTTAACATSGDAGIDADNGIYLNGGTVTASGNMFDHIAGGTATYAVLSFAQSQEGCTAYTLKNESGEAVAEWTPANSFTYLVVAGEDIVPGTYTLWQGDTQLAGMNGQNGMGMIPGGFGGVQRPEGGFDAMPIPDGVTENEDGTITLPDGSVIDPSQMPEGGFGRGERPEMPQGNFEASPIPEGGFGGKELPQMPEGNMQMPQMPPEDGFGGGRGGFGGFGQQGGADMSLLSAEFVIAEGGNYFTGISAMPAKQNV